MEDALLIAARVALSGVFALAGVAKLRDLDGTREALAAFGAPRGAVAPIGVALPLVELVVAVALLPARSALVGAVGALALLVLFSVAIAANLARGRAPECHCFGQLHSEPAGPQTLARNAALAAVAVFVLAAGGGPSAVAWIAELHGTGLVAFVAGVGGAALLASAVTAFVMLLRAYGSVLLRVEKLERALADAGIEVEESAPERPAPLEYGLELGAPAPSFEVEDVTGERVSLADLLASELPVMLVFASPQCGPCAALLPTIADWQREHSGRVTVAIVSDGPHGDIRAAAQEQSLRRVLLDEGGELYEAFGARGTPGAVLISAEGAVASHVAAGRGGIEELLDAALQAPTRRPVEDALAIEIHEGRPVAGAGAARGGGR